MTFSCLNIDYDVLYMGDIINHCYIVTVSFSVRIVQNYFLFVLFIEGIISNMLSWPVGPLQLDLVKDWTVETHHACSQTSSGPIRDLCY